MIKLHVHNNAEADLDRHFEYDEDGVGYLDATIALIDEQERLKEKLSSENYEREYDEPIGLLGMETKPIISLRQQGIRVMRIRLDDGSVLSSELAYLTTNTPTELRIALSNEPLTQFTLPKKPDKIPQQHYLIIIQPILNNLTVKRGDTLHVLMVQNQQIIAQSPVLQII